MARTNEIAALDEFDRALKEFLETIYQSQRELILSASYATVYSQDTATQRCAEKAQDVADTYIRSAESLVNDMRAFIRVNKDGVSNVSSFSTSAASTALPALPDSKIAFNDNSSIPFDNEGVDNLRLIATKLWKVYEDVDQARAVLKTSLSNVADKIGPIETFEEYMEQLKSLEDRYAVTFDDTKTNLNNIADTLESLLP